MYRRVTGCFWHNIPLLHKVVRNGLVSEGFRWVWAAHHARHVRKTVLGLYLLVTGGLTRLWLRPWQLWSAPWPGRGYVPCARRETTGPFPPSPESIPSSNEVTTTYNSVFIYLQCCKNKDVYAFMVRLWAALTPISHSPVKSWKREVPGASLFPHASASLMLKE